MKTRLFSVFALALAVALPVFAQHDKDTQHERDTQHGSDQHNTPRANQGHVPPPPPARNDRHAKPEAERHDQQHINSVPHVSNDHWYGHDRPDDRRFRISHPFEHGRFEHFGPTYRYNIIRIDRDHRRFWFPGGFFFEVASWDWSICADWCWDCGDDYVVYEDSDHIGWYMLYNVHTGVYVHVQYMGM